MARWLLTGGAGYIGAHVAKAFVDSGREVVVLDDLSTGLRSRLNDDVPFVEGDVKESALVEEVLRDYSIDGVVHLAAKKVPQESIDRPVYYFDQNVGGVLSLLEAMERSGVSRLVYSSSAAVYGEVETSVVDELDPTAPIHPYGETKLIGEWAIRANANAARSHGRLFDDVSLRYFNVAGAAGPELGDKTVENLIPLAFRAMVKGEPPQIFGDDYPTPDGTAIRDYIHVVDVAQAHVDAAYQCEQGKNESSIYNLGTGKGYSVRQVLDAVTSTAGFPGEPVVVGRRKGDPAAVVAAVDRANSDLGWKAQLDLADMVSSAWLAWQEK